MKKFLIFIMLISLSQYLKAEDTIRIMQYNLLYYGKQTSFCTTSNNYIEYKNQYLQTIINYVKPDIFGVNELDGEDAYPISNDDQYLLDNALNVNGVNYYRKTEAPKAYLANIIYYNTNKVILKSSHIIDVTYNGLKKYFNAYKFYYNSDDLATINDTAYFYCVVAHLKAGNYADDLTQKAYESNKIMNYFESIGEAGNYFIMGDLNVYTPTEECFQNFINPDNSLYTFYDPANQIGEWSGNSDYSYYHTQSTHTSGECYSTGGMDDRFDFILASDYIMNGTDHFQYITDSYKAIGQDGSKFNQALNIVTNSTVPANVAQALYLMSDHLPVYMELKVDQNRGEPLSIDKIENKEINLHFNNPVENNLYLSIESDLDKNVTCQIISLNGQIKFQQTIWLNFGFNRKEISVSDLESGIYIIKLHDVNKQLFSGKLVKNDISD